MTTRSPFLRGPSIRPRNSTVLQREEIEMCSYCERKPAREDGYCCEAHAHYDREGRP